MKRLSYTVLAAALFAGALSLRSAWAQYDEGPGSKDGPPPHQAPVDKMKEKLGLTDDQQAKLEATMKAHEEAVKPLRRAMRDLMNKLQDQIEDKVPDSDIQATLDKINSTMKSMQAAEEKLRKDGATFLTPTQRAKIAIAMMGQQQGSGMGQRGRAKRAAPSMGGDNDKKGPPPSDKDDDGDGD